MEDRRVHILSNGEVYEDPGPPEDIGAATRRAMSKLPKSATPEMRLLQRHYIAMGEDDEKKLRRLDPKQHAFGCRCMRCDTNPYPCTYPGCERVSSGKIRAASHMEWHKQQDKKLVARNLRVQRHALRPAGLDFVTALLGDPVRAARLDVREIRLLHERLFGDVKHRKTRIARMRSALAAIDDAPKSQTFKLTATAPQPIAAVVQRLAILAGVPPTTVVAALLAWGIEKFSSDIRAMRVISAVHVEPALATPRPPGAFPSADEVLEA